MYSFIIPMTRRSGDCKVLFIYVPCCNAVTVYFSGHWRLQLMKLTYTVWIGDHMYTIICQETFRCDYFTLKAMVRLAESGTIDSLNLTSIAGRSVEIKQSLKCIYYDSHTATCIFYWLWEIDELLSLNRIAPIYHELEYVFTFPSIALFTLINIVNKAVEKSSNSC